MFFVYPGPDGSTVTIKDPKTDKVEVVAVKRPTAKQATNLPSYAQPAAFMVSSFRT